MKPATFHVFRIQCERLLQGRLFARERRPTEVIFEAIQSMPTASVRRGTEWHIAGAEDLGQFSIGFQIGRVQSVNTPQYDDSLRRFFESDAERAPFTWGVYDGATQACGIWRKSGVSLDAFEVGKKLETLLNQSGVPDNYGYAVSVDVIFDPEDFIQYLRNAYEIKRFRFTSHFENAHDVQRLIQKPA